MSRTRISTTVDDQLLQRARRMAAAANDAELIDRALESLTRTIGRERELSILDALPYDNDPQLALPEAQELPDGVRYDGDVPADVVALARSRRRAT